MTDYISIKKIWQDPYYFQVRIICAASHIVATNDIYTTDDNIDTLRSGIKDFIKGKTGEFLWENGEKGDDSTACIILKFIHKDRLGHILIEVYMELDDGGKYSSHNCCFYINTELGLLEKFCKNLPILKQKMLGAEVILNDLK